MERATEPREGPGSRKGTGESHTRGGGGEKELCAGNEDPPIQRPRMAVAAAADITDLN